MSVLRPAAIRAAVAGVLGAVLLLCCGVVPAAGAAGPIDITAQVLADQDVRLTGGNYVIKVPKRGAVGTTTVGALELKGKAGNVPAGQESRYGVPFVDAATSAIRYSGVIRGTGRVTVTNATSTVQRHRSVTGGALVFLGGRGPQRFTHRTGQPLVIDRNTSVVFAENASNATAFAGKRIGVVNNGMLNSFVGYGWGSITGAGSATFGRDYGWHEDDLGTGKHYSGRVFVLWGTHIQTGARLSSTLALWQQGIASFETVRASLTDPAPHIDTFAGPYYNAGPDTQIQRGGIQRFSGEAFLIPGVTDPALLPRAESRKFNGMYGIRMQKGRTFYNIGTMLMGDGRKVIHRKDGSDNTFLQGNAFGQNAMIQMGQWQFTPPTSLANVRHDYQTIAFHYSGTYSFNGKVGIDYANDRTLQPYRGGTAWGNLIVKDPDPRGTGRAPNHLILTQPVITHGVVLIERNAVLQLGDGTRGNDAPKTVTVAGVRYVGRKSTSSGNGMVLTAANAPSTSPRSYYQIDNRGTLVVNNVRNAMNLVNAVGNMRTLMQRNLLDGIVGRGSVVQTGTLPLTLTGVNRYTGGTVVDRGSELRVASTRALGKRTRTTGGDVRNLGTLAAGATNRTITVPGDYRQTR